jgi:hypothetical protein
MVVLIIGTYQYIEFYVITAFVLVAIPFYGLYRFVKYIFYYISLIKYRKAFKSKKFNANEVKGDHECQICMLAYAEQDKVVTLPCN